MKKFRVDINDLCLIVLSVLLILLLLPSKCQATTLKEIDKWCKTYKYNNCVLVKAIAKRESSLNPLAFNPEKSGSYGLMQLQCSTAKMVGLKYGCDQLFNGQVNTRFGIKYLQWIEDRLLEPTVRNIIAAYNAGLGKREVKKKTSVDGSIIKVKGFSPRRCKNYNEFKYDGFPKMECFPGEYLNEEYVWKVIRIYRYYRLKNIKEGASHG